VRASTVLSFVVLSGLFFSQAAFAQHGEHEPDFPSLYSKQPAKRYSGSTPIDMGNGLLGNNGTIGQPNMQYEAWAQTPAVVAGLSEAPYDYRQKGEFVRTMKEQILWGETAISNWKSTSKITRPEAVEYSKQAVAKMTPALDKLKSATDRADGAGEKDWANAESEARKALIDFRAAYTQMHHNTQWLSRRAQVER
jgi:hypothetical protein